MRGYILISLFMLSLAGEMQARHIIGGVMSYECISSGQYRFTLKMYRDCNCVNCADFDPEAAIAVYRCVGDVCLGASQLNNFTTANVPLGNVTAVDIPDYPCLVPPPVCVQEGIYEFTLNLPVDTTRSYHISYQRCCRNETIDNLLFPGDQGATFSVEIPPEAQKVCNSSPVFDDFPPTVICINEPLEYDHSATDADGDQLVYSFCAPRQGGGPILDAANYQTCFGAQPTPACPPPYPQVVFAAPTYTPGEPMGGAPLVTINTQTGLITGTPDVQGQFVVGVCVEEFRDGVLLSRVFRDFQFNVAPCDPTVVADIREDVMIADQEFQINSCGRTTISFDNESFQEANIDFQEWTFDLGNGDTLRTDEWEPTITFPGIGEYRGQLILNKNTDCGDTAEIYVNIYPDIAANFEFAYDTCVAGPTQFTDLSTTGSCCLTNWSWNYGDGFSDTGPQFQNPSHRFQIPGDLPVTLTVTDTNQCEADTTIVVPYFPAPALIVIAPSAETLCAPGTVFFNNLSIPIDSTYDIVWDFGDGGMGSAVSPTYTYEDPGLYTVSVDITSPIGCQIDTTFSGLIRILGSPVADFSFSPEAVSNIEPEVDFRDESTGAVGYFWDFGDGTLSNQINPSHTYRDTGIFIVQQVVTHPSGCRDTALATINVVPEVRYFLPNAFTPNGDGRNDTFFGKGFLLGATNFEFSIWNRWGERIFVTNDPDEGWNGQKNNNGQDSPPGVYLVQVNFIGPRGEPFAFKSTVSLLR